MDDAASFWGEPPRRDLLYLFPCHVGTICVAKSLSNRIDDIADFFLARETSRIPAFDPSFTTLDQTTGDVTNNYRDTIVVRRNNNL